MTHTGNPFGQVLVALVDPVAREVLDGCRDPLTLQTLDIGGAERGDLV